MRHDLSIAAATAVAISILVQPSAAQTPKPGDLLAQAVANTNAA